MTKTILLLILTTIALTTANPCNAQVPGPAPDGMKWVQIRSMRWNGSNDEYRLMADTVRYDPPWPHVTVYIHDTMWIDLALKPVPFKVQKDTSHPAVVLYQLPSPRHPTATIGFYQKKWVTENDQPRLIADSDWMIVGGGTDEIGYGNAARHYHKKKPLHHKKRKSLPPAEIYQKDARVQACTMDTVRGIIVYNDGQPTEDEGNTWCYGYWVGCDALSVMVKYWVGGDQWMIPGRYRKAYYDDKIKAHLVGEYKGRFFRTGDSAQIANWRVYFLKIN